MIVLHVHLLAVIRILLLLLQIVLLHMHLLPIVVLKGLPLR